MNSCTNSSLSLDRARMHKIFDTATVEQKCRSIENTPESQSLLNLYREMLLGGPERFLASPSSPDCLSPLYERCLNFHPLLDELAGALLLSAEGGGPTKMDPILLLGEPGVGKTHFAQLLGKALGTTCAIVSMGQLTAGWIIGGSAAQWKGAKKGKVAESLIDGLYANPVILLDEIDKAAGSTQYDPLGTLYTLLEGETASRFVDEFVDLPIDTSYVHWVATANDASAIPKPLLNRMRVIEIPAPTPEAMRTIIKTVYGEILHEEGWKFNPEIDEQIVEIIVNAPPRSMKQSLHSAFRFAKLAGRDHLIPIDLNDRGRVGHKMGFLS